MQGGRVKHQVYVVISRPKSKKITLAAIKEWYKTIHPDCYLRADSVKIVQNMINLNLKTEKELEKILFLAGNIAKLEYKKKSASPDHLEQAIKCFEKSKKTGKQPKKCLNQTQKPALRSHSNRPF